jgi:hypothetical protein
MASPFGALRLHSLNTPHSVGLLWTNDQPDAESSTRQHTTQTREGHPYPSAVRTHIPSKREAADPRRRRHDHWDGRLVDIITDTNQFLIFTQYLCCQCSLLFSRRLRFLCLRNIVAIDGHSVMSCLKK